MCVYVASCLRGLPSFIADLLVCGAFFVILPYFLHPYTFLPTFYCCGWCCYFYCPNYVSCCACRLTAAHKLATAGAGKAAPQASTSASTGIAGRPQSGAPRSPRSPRATGTIASAAPTAASAARPSSPRSLSPRPSSSGGIPSSLVCTCTPIGMLPLFLC